MMIEKDENDPFDKDRNLKDHKEQYVQRNHKRKQK